MPLTSRQVVNALVAASTAMSTSSFPARDMEASTSSVEGSIVSKVWPDLESTNSLLMNNWVKTESELRVMVADCSRL